VHNANAHYLCGLWLFHQLQVGAFGKMAVCRVAETSVTGVNLDKNQSQQYENMLLEQTQHYQCQRAAEISGRQNRSWTSQ
jgi:hypothetical protein